MFRVLLRRAFSNLTFRLVTRVFICTDEALEKYYAGAQTVATPGAFAENVFAWRRWDVNRQMDDLTKPVDKSQWYMTPVSEQAFLFLSFPFNDATKLG
jgi:hypothetical protein